MGEWLTRRILRSLGEAEAAPEPWWSTESRCVRESAAARAPGDDSAEMRAGISRSELESQLAGRHLDEQLKNLSRRLEQTERGQSENVRAMSRSETEFDIQSREQALALERLDARLAHLNERILQIEQDSQVDGMRDAIKALHQGLSRLTDQIADTSRNSTSHSAQLASTVEALAERLAICRDENQEGSHVLANRILVTERALEQLATEQPGRIDDKCELRRQGEIIAQRVLSAEKALEKLQTGHNDETGEIRRKGEVIAQRVLAAEKTLEELAAAQTVHTDETGEIHRQGETIAQRVLAAEKALEKLETAQTVHSDETGEIRRQGEVIAQRVLATEKALEELAAAQTVHADETGEIRRQGEILAQLSNALGNLTREFAAGERLRAAAFARIETRLSQIEERPDDTATVRRRMQSVEDALTDVTARVDRWSHEEAHISRTLHDELLSLELRLDMAQRSNQEAVAELGAVVREAAKKLEHVHPAQPPLPMQPIPIPALDLPANVGSLPAATAEHLDETDAPAQPAARADVDARDTDHETRQPRPDSFMAAARRTVSAASAARADRVARGAVFTWRSSPTDSDAGERRGLRPFLLAALGLVAVCAVTAALVLRNNISAPVAKLLPAVSSAEGDAATANFSGRAQTARALPAAVVVAAGSSPRNRLTTLAVAGNATAQELLGLRYIDGDGVPMNEAEGAKWLERAASQGEAIAAYRLGTLYERGQGVPADPARAVRWYMAAAESGNRLAMHNLAVAYAEGLGVAKNPVAAAEWFARASDLGLADSQFNLGILYERGMGVPQSLIEAYKWYSIAAAAGDAESRARVVALDSELNADDKAAARKAAADFHTRPESPAANTLPDAATMVGG